MLLLGTLGLCYLTYSWVPSPTRLLCLRSAAMRTCVSNVHLGTAPAPGGLPAEGGGPASSWASAGEGVGVHRLKGQSWVRDSGLFFLLLV